MEREPTPDWSQIVQVYGRRVFAVAMRILGSVQDAEDVAQEVFLEAYEIYQSGSVHSWVGLLVRLATFRSLDLRRRRRPVATFHERECSTCADPADNLIRNELAESLRRAVSRLPVQQAAVFIMSQFEQMSREEIAQNLGISTDAVSTSLYKARQRLSEELSLAHKEQFR